MKLVLLPGNSPSNCEWIEKVRFSLSDKYDNIIFLKYEHWKHKNKSIDLDLELDRLITILNNCNQDYVIFAKTAGVALTLKGIYEGKINPKRCIFLGVPIVWARLNDFKIDDWFFNYEYPTLFIQKTGDPAMFHDELKTYLKNKSLKDYTIVEMLGEDMKYNEVDLIKDEIINYLDDIKDLIY
ncbi:MAG: hypothetical protein PF569_02760 [Candidatus Woesearchaeota archaeon]|jgi:hypothetical protein|nr:hypothetical protein [Candidatus Woesearchaeota archaeon]